MNNLEWFKTLKIGDTVCYDTGYNENHEYYITSVLKITPTGKVKTSDGMTFDSTNSTSVSAYRYCSLQPVNEEILEYIKKKELLLRISEVNFNKLNLNQIEQIIAIINKE
jgi:hypothetical protein